MNLFYIVIYTANILGIFTDPFEFAGDYGPEINPTRDKVFELVVSKEALSKNLTDSQVRELLQDPFASNLAVEQYREYLTVQALKADKDYGPTFSELVTPELVKELANKQHQLSNAGFTENDLSNFLHFLEQYGNKKVFHFFRNNPSSLLCLDVILRDKAAREGKNFDLPILSSTQTLQGQSCFDLKRNLLDAVFTEETLSITKSEDALKKSIRKLDEKYLQQFFGSTANNKDLEIFASPAGQVFFYWIYQSLNLHLISVDNSMIEQINKVKELFLQTLGNPVTRARTFREKLLEANSGILFTQESDTFVPQVLTRDGLFLPYDKQNLQEGCFVFLRSDLWEADYQIIPIEGSAGYDEGRMSVILATQKTTGEKFLLASCHGNSTRPEDGRLQISLVKEKFEQLSQQYPKLQLMIGIDANTKSDKDVDDLKEHLNKLGLIATDVGPTTVKRRMVTAQHAKAGRFAIDQEDFLITLKPECGGHYLFTHPTVGFKEENADINKPLPNLDNQSDHYPVGVKASAI